MLGTATLITMLLSIPIVIIMTIVIQLTVVSRMVKIIKRMFTYDVGFSNDNTIVLFVFVNNFIE